MSAGRIAAVSLLTRKLLPFATPATCSSPQIVLDNAVAGPLLRASQLLLQHLTAPSQCHRWVQTAAEQTHPQQQVHRSQVFHPTQHNNGPVNRRTTQSDWNGNGSDDEFQYSSDQQEYGTQIPKPLFNHLKQLAKEGQIEELVNLYSTEETLHATHPFNVGLINMPARYVPRFYQAVVDTINVQPNALSVAVLIRSLGKLNRLSQAEAIWSDWQAQGLPQDPVVVGAMCGAYAVAANPQAIEQMVEDAKAAGLPPVMAAYTSLIKAYGANHSLTDVRRVLVEMKEDGVAPNQLHYRTAVIAHGHAGRPLEGQYLLTEMAAMGVVPDVMTIGSMVYAYAEAKQPRRAAAVMQQYTDAGGEPTQQLCNQLAKAWGRQGEIGEVRAIMANMRNSGIQTDIYTWSSLVYACAVAGQMGKAREAMKEMAGTGMAPGVVCYTILLNAYGKQGDLAAAESVLRDMQANDIRPNKYTYSSLMGWHSQEGNLSKVQALQQEMADQGIQGDAVSHMFGIEAAMEAWDRAGRPKQLLTEADALLHQSPVLKMKPIVKSHDSRSWRSTYIDLHGYCHWTCQLALIDGLRQLFQSYLTPGWVWPQADFVVAVGRGNNSEHKHHPQTRTAVLHFLQQLVSVRLAAKNDGLVVVKRQDMLKLFGIVRREQDNNPFEVTRYGPCFKPRTEVLEYAGPSMF